MFIDRHLSEFRLETMCRVLDVTVSGFHTWRRRPPSLRSVQDAALSSRIQAVYQEHHGRYGAPRIHATLQREGTACSEKRVSRLMRAQGLVGRTRRRLTKTTVCDPRQPVAENLLAGEFRPEKPNEVWSSDLTYISTKEGWLYLAVTLDLYARCVVGWAMEATMPAELPLQALQMAVNRRNPAAGLMHHSDQGSQYTSGLFQTALIQRGMICSMSRKGECWDNAVSESFFETLKRELVDDQVYETREQARRAIFEYIEVYYNRKRLHSTLGYLTPEETDRQALVA